MSFVFYDTETTGTHTAFDQILQFAAIHTDPELNELERFDIRCRLLPHIAPSPSAMLITGVTADQLVDPKRPTHYEMIHTIHGKLRSWSPAVFVGFNSLHFDEHLLRQAFYQTLHPIYVTNTSGNCRGDAMRVAQAASIFAPGTLVYPVNEWGEKIFKLDKLARANGFGHPNPHDALGDVEATIFLCRMVLERAPDLWSNFLRFSQKASVREYVLAETVFSLSDFYYGKPYSWIVSPVGISPSNSSELIVFDLATDPNDLQDLPEDHLVARLTEYPKPVRRIRANACPIIMPVDDAPDIASSKCLGRDELERRAQVLAEDERLRHRLISTLEQIRDAKETSIHVEQQIYDGFYSSGDEEILHRFHDVAWKDRIQLIAKLEDRRLRQLGLRLLYFERPELLDDEVRRDIETQTLGRLIQDQITDAWLTLPNAIQEIDELLITTTGEQANCLREHRKLLLDRMERLTTTHVDTSSSNPAVA